MGANRNRRVRQADRMAGTVSRTAGQNRTRPPWKSRPRPAVGLYVGKLMNHEEWEIINYTTLCPFCERCVMVTDGSLEWCPGCNYSRDYLEENE